MGGFPSGSVVKNPPAVQETQETQVHYPGWEITWRRKWQPTPVLLSGESHGQRSVVGYSPWGHKESDMTEQLTLSLSNIYCTFKSLPSFCTLLP